jgi:hypothetical protein
MGPKRGIKKNSIHFYYLMQFCYKMWQTDCTIANRNLDLFQQDIDLHFLCMLITSISVHAVIEVHFRLMLFLSLYEINV